MCYHIGTACQAQNCPHITFAFIYASSCPIAWTTLVGRGHYPNQLIIAEYWVIADHKPYLCFESWLWRNTNSAK